MIEVDFMRLRNFFWKRIIQIFLWGRADRDDQKERGTTIRKGTMVKKKREPTRERRMEEEGDDQRGALR